MQPPTDQPGCAPLPATLLHQQPWPQTQWAWAVAAAVHERSCCVAAACTSGTHSLSLGHPKVRGGVKPRWVAGRRVPYRVLGIELLQLLSLLRQRLLVPQAECLLGGRDPVDELGHLLPLGRKAGGLRLQPLALLLGPAQHLRARPGELGHGGWRQGGATGPAAPLRTPASAAPTRHCGAIASGPTSPCTGSHGASLPWGRHTDPRPAAVMTTGQECGAGTGMLHGPPMTMGKDGVPAGQLGQG